MESALDIPVKNDGTKVKGISKWVEVSISPPKKKEKLTKKDKAQILNDLVLTEFIDYFSEENLLKISGESKLEDVKELELHVDTTDQPIAHLGEMMPNLVELRLTNSLVPTCRDLGTSLKNLKILWLKKCGINDLSGIGALFGLRELYLAFNNITDLTPLSLHDELEIVDLDSNNISDVLQLSQLGTCSSLTTVNLESNPICSVKSYRSVVMHYIPHLKVLDDLEIQEEDLVEVGEEILTSASELRGFLEKMMEYPAESCSIMQLVPSPPKSSPLKNKESDIEKSNEAFPKNKDDEEVFVKSTRRPNSSESVSSNRSRPVSARTLRPSSASILIRPTTAIKDKYTQLLNPVSSDDNSTTPFRRELTTTSSELTHGSDVVFAGNAALSMRRRKKQTDDEELDAATAKLLNNINNHDKVASSQIEEVEAKEDLKDKESPLLDNNIKLERSDSRIEKEDSIETSANYKLYNDEVLIKMLRQKPKHVLFLQTKEAFRIFFNGILKSHMTKLLTEAYNDVPGNDRNVKVNKRLMLLEGIFAIENFSSTEL